MKKLLILAAIALSACAKPKGLTLADLPESHPPVIADVFGTVLGITLSYPPGVDHVWESWRGSVDVYLGMPDPGLGYLPVERVEFGPSFGSLLDEPCFDFDPDDGLSQWVYIPETGELMVMLFLGPVGDRSTLTFHGFLEISYGFTSSGAGDDVRAPVDGFQPYLNARGTWEVRLDDSCPPDSFEGGTEGVWEAGEGSQLLTPSVVKERVGVIYGIMDGEFVSTTEIVVSR